MLKRKIGACVLAVGLVGSGFAATVTIDPGTQYQTIEGFGFFGQCNQYGDQSYTDFIHNDFGVSMVRMMIPHDFEPSNDNNDANNLDLSKFNLTGGMARWFTVVNGMKRFEDVRFIATIWTPPGWMKDMTRDHWNTAYDRCSDGTDACGGHLRADMREELAEYMVAFYKAIEQRTGVKLYGMSLQNESAFIEWYVSCVYTAEEYRDALKVVGARFEREGIDIKLFGAEDMVSAIPTYAQKIGPDPDAKKHLYAYAVHGYSDGVNPIPSSVTGQSWDRLGKMAKDALGSKLWMTETSGFAETWTGALSLGSNIFASLKYGFLSAWVFWSDNECSEYGLLCNGQHTLRSAVSKNFYRWIRPGAVQITSTSDNESVLVTTFLHPTNKTFTAVIQNTGAATTISLSANGLPAQLEKHVSTASKKCVAEGTVGSGGDIELEANSFTTLYGTGYEPSVAVQRELITPRGAQAARAAAPRTMYSLDGRRAGSERTGSAGIAIVKSAGVTRMTLVPGLAR